MKVHRRVPWVAIALLIASTSCQEQKAPSLVPKQDTPQVITNRLDLPPEVVSNLGITFEKAVRGRVGLWRDVPGQFEVPESRRWIVRAPARSRVISIASRWESVTGGTEVVTLSSAMIPEAQRSIELALRTAERAKLEALIAKERHAESERHLAEAHAFEEASRQRLEELQGLGASGNSLTAREILEAKRTVTDASKARLDAAIVHDDLESRAARKALEADQAELSVREELSELAVLTGSSVGDLLHETGEGPLWQTLQVVSLRSPASGVVVDLLSSQGEIVEAGTPLVQIFDLRELRFRGHVPEGDSDLLILGNRVRLALPARNREPIEAHLDRLIPIADPDTRMIHFEAVVPNVDGTLIQGTSVMASILVEESPNEEVLVPERCVVMDGLETIIFKRDPNDPNIVIRTPVELGLRGAGWVEVLAGALDGDEIVAAGVHQLKQTGLGKAPEGGHFHADGTWHTGDK